MYARLDTKKGGKDLYQLDIDRCRRGVRDPIYKGDVKSCLQRDHFDEPCHENELFKDRLRREVKISMAQDCMAVLMEKYRKGQKQLHFCLT